MDRRPTSPEKGLANPTSLMLAAAMMLEHVDLGDAARRLRSAIEATLNVDKVRTRDLKGSASTRQFADALCRRLASA